MSIGNSVLRSRLIGSFSSLGETIKLVLFTSALSDLVSIMISFFGFMVELWVFWLRRAPELLLWIYEGTLETLPLFGVVFFCGLRAPRLAGKEAYFGTLSGILFGVAMRSQDCLYLALLTLVFLF